MKIAVAGATGLIGSQVVDIAASEGHEVVKLARSTGFDLLKPDGLEEALADVDGIVDVTQSPSLEGSEATEFFTTVAGNLGRAAHAAGVNRTVVLSIVGADRSPDFGYYVAKVAHEDATRAGAPGPVVLRATQFHEFAGQMLDWSRDGEITYIMDVPTQPVASNEIAAMLVSLVTADTAADVEMAGPKEERLVDQVERLVARRGDAVAVQAVQAPESMANGSMLPGPNAVIRGPEWEDWMSEAE